MTLNPRDHWDIKNNASFVSITIPVMNEINQILSMIIRSEIIAHSPKTTCADADIKSIKSCGGIEKLDMLHFTAAATFNSMKNEEPKELCGIIECHKAAALEPINSFVRVIAASKPTMARYESKWDDKRKTSHSAQRKKRN